MKKNELVEKTVHILIDYYNNNTEPFLSSLDDECLWYGPAEGQFLSGKAAITAAWNREGKPPLTFTMENINTTCISSAPSFLEVMVSFHVTTHYENGTDIVLYQRIHISWGIKKSHDASGHARYTPRIIMCHITNPHPKSDADEIYPVHFESVFRGSFPISRNKERIHFRAVDNSDYFLLADSIIWAGSAANGKHSVLHTTGDEIEIVSTITELAVSHPDLFLRCHTSYLVNPDYVKGIRRFTVIMDDGTELSVPEKKYTSFKKLLMERKNVLK